MRSLASPALWFALLATASLAVSCSGAPIPGPSQFSSATASNVDALIDPRMSVEDRAAMRWAMEGLAPWQMQNVVFFDNANDGRIYANNPEALSRAFYYHRVAPGVIAGPDGEAIVEPQSERGFQGIRPQVSCPAPPATSGGTGPFYRLYVSCTSWMTNKIYPFPFPWFQAAPGHECDQFVFNGNDQGYVTIGGFSPTGAEAEMNVTIKHTDAAHGFSFYMSYASSNLKCGGPPLKPCGTPMGYNSN